MAKNLHSTGRRTEREELQEVLIPVADADLKDPILKNEISDVVAEIVLLGRRKYRTDKKDVEVSDAA